MPDVSHSPAEQRFDTAAHERAAVAVAVTLYNYGELVSAALESVREQTLADIDLIVVDDGSSDGGADRVLDWMHTHHARFGRCTLLQHTANAGLAAARNHGFQRAQTDYVFVLDADNELYPRCLEACLHAAVRSGAEAVHTIIEVFGSPDDVGLMGTDLWDPGRLADHNYIDAMALVSRAAWQQVGGYRRMPETGWEDYDFWLKFVECGFDVVRVPEILCRYRAHARSMLRTITNRPHSQAVLQHDLDMHHPYSRRAR